MSKELDAMTREELLAFAQEQSKQLESKKKGLYWNDQQEAAQKQLEDCFPVLVRQMDKDVIHGGNNHLLIEGENLYALLDLQATHRGKIGIIYIDPPYNTDNKDFIYEDGFETSMWLSCMRNRLILARELMTDNGVIFISIDDIILYELKLLMDQIFGANNFIANMIWPSKKGGANDVTCLRIETEYILVYSKRLRNDENRVVSPFNKEKAKVIEDNKYKESDEYVETRGKYTLNQLDRVSLGYQASLDFPITMGDLTAIPGGNENPLKKWRWRWGKEKVERGIKNGFIVLKTDKEGRVKCYTKQYQFCDNEGAIIERQYPYSNMIPSEISTVAANCEIKQIMGSAVFTYPKPTTLIYHLLKIAAKKDSIVLDFFAGSGTTAHAVLNFNQNEGMNLQFILVQNNERKISENKEPLPHGICEDITHPRIKKVMDQQQDGNLRYFKAGLVPKGNCLDESKLIVAENTEPVAQIDSNMFGILEQNERFSIYKSEADEFVAVLKQEIYWEELKTFIAENSLSNIKIYVCSFSDDNYSDCFGNENCENLTEKILGSFKASGISNFCPKSL